MKQPEPALVLITYPTITYPTFNDPIPSFNSLFLRSPFFSISLNFYLYFNVEPYGPIALHQLSSFKTLSLRDNEYSILSTCYY